MSLAPSPTYTDSLGRTYTRQVPIERFLDKIWVHPMSGCWHWTASLDSHGYGQFQRGRGYGGLTRAYKWAYEHFVGPVPEGLELDHLCRNKTCVFPGHLEPVTHRENVLRGPGASAIHARMTECKNGHPFVGRTSGGIRTCGQCRPGRVYPF